MRKKYANLYVKLTAKSPFLFLILILISIVFLFGVTLTTKVDVIETCNVKVENNKICIQNVTDIMLDEVYVYENRNEAVYKVKIEPEMVRQENNSLEISVNELGFIPQSDFVNVDIPIQQITLFRRVFLQGGKNE
jgi:hypothetical protein